MLDKLAAGDIEYRVPHFYGIEGRYWVTRLLDVRERVEKEAEKIDDPKALSLVMNTLESLLAKPREKRGEWPEAVLFKAKPVVLKEPALLDLDPMEYMLVVIAPPLPEVEEGAYTEGVLYDLVYYKESGAQKSPRRYANSIAVLLSNKADTWREILKKAKKVLACDQLMETLKKEVDSRSFKYIREELRSLKEGLENSLRESLVAGYFNLIAYPDVDKDRGTNVVRVSKVTTPADRTLVELAEKALIDAGKAIKREEADFKTLLYYFSGGSTQKWTMKISVQDVVNAFLENPAFPMIRANYIKDA
ncbi:MAG: DUF499 domain-containing protein, partial [Desulfurococcaceae archaeon]